MAFPAAPVRAPSLRHPDASKQLYKQRTQPDKLLEDINNPGMCLTARWVTATCMCEHTNGGFLWILGGRYGLKPTEKRVALRFTFDFDIK